MDERPTKRRGPMMWLAGRLHSWHAGLLIGFLIGAAFPVAVAAYWMLQDRLSRAAIPLAPNTAGCGTGVAMMLFFVAPAVGTIGSVIGAMICHFSSLGRTQDS